MSDDVQDWRAVLDGRREWAMVLGDNATMRDDVPRDVAVITDPPYGVAMKRGDGKIKAEQVHGDDAPPDIRWIATFARAVVWGGNNFCDQLPRAVGWLVWNKTFPECARFSQAELAWTNTVRTVRLYTEAYHGFMRQRDGWHHPMQKPTGLLSWCMDRAKVPADGIVFDPYAGSGSCGVAALQTGRRYIGVEIDPTYHATAVARLTQAATARQPALPLTMEA